MFEIKRQLMADLAANNELECRKTLHWAGQDAEAGSWFVTVPKTVQVSAVRLKPLLLVR